MELSALLTSAGINIALSVFLVLLYSVLRKQPSLVCVYFGQRLAQAHSKRNGFYGLERLIPSTSWIMKAWQTSEEEIFANGGLDAVAFLRMIVFSIRIFSIAAIICVPLVLPLNYFGKEMQHKHIPSESLEVFTILNVKERSKWLWVHCLALYIITCSACVLLYFDYKSISKMRLEKVAKSPKNPSYFTVLVRGIPWSAELSYSHAVTEFFTTYCSKSYLSHQMVYRSGTIQKLVIDAQEMYEKLKSSTLGQECGSSTIRRGFCGGVSNSFKTLSSESESTEGRNDFGDLGSKEKECSAALVFFRTRYAALAASLALQSQNPMLWVTDMAPEPHDIYWANLRVPYRLFWIRRIATLLASIVFMFFFLAPVTLVQGLVHLDKLQKRFPFMRGILKRKMMVQLVTGYLPSVIMLLFLCIVPPIMKLFSTVEGAISRSGRKQSICSKFLFFLVWNIFFANILSGTVMDRLDRISNPKYIPSLLARAVPSTATFFMTYVLTSGWAGLSCELVQPFGILCVILNHLFLRHKKDQSYALCSFPYHTEIPRVLLFGLLGFTCSVLAPLILPLLLVFFSFAFLVYRNQILNVYASKYPSNGLYWPLMHTTTIFSLVLTQIIALGIFGLRESTVASGFTFPLIICTLLFNEYCRQRFHPIFKNIAAQVFIDMDCQDENCGRKEEIYEQLLSAYCQFESTSLSRDVKLSPCKDGDELQDQEKLASDLSKSSSSVTPTVTNQYPCMSPKSLHQTNSEKGFDEDQVLPVEHSDLTIDIK